jgi:protochlorophyllide reductase
MKGWTAEEMPDQTGRVVIITGANSGLGYESAIALARKGACVVMACRHIEKAQRARQDLLNSVPNSKVDILPLDLCSLESVRTFAESFNLIYDRLDILINNAGVMWMDYGKTKDGFELQLGTNHLGHFALTGLLLPKLLQTPRSRIVTVSSSGYFSGRIDFNDLHSERHYNRINAYAQSKLANILFALELQRKLHTAHSDTMSVVTHPGYTFTNLQINGGSKAQKPALKFLSPILGMTASVGATYQLYAATAPEVSGGTYYGPKWLVRGQVARVALNARATDSAVADRLWQVSEQLTGVHYNVMDTPASAHTG